MKRLFTFAIIAMIASMTFAQESGSVLGKATRPVATALQMKAPKTLSAIAAQNVRTIAVGQNIPASKQKVKMSDAKFGKYAVSVEPMFKARTAPAKPRKAQLVDGQTYYIQNVESGLFLAGNNAWGTQASATTAGDPVQLLAVDGGYNLVGTSLTGGNKTLGYNLYVDTAPASNGNLWTIGGEEDAYTFYGKGKVDGAENAFDGYIAQSTTAGPVAGYLLEGAAQVTDAAKWRLVTKEDIIAGIKDGSNISTLLDNPGFTRSHATTSWIVDEGCTNKNLSGGANNNACAESYHSVFNIHQAVSGLPNGTYTVTAQGFYRQDGSDNDNLPVFYANDVTTAFPNVTTEGTAEADDNHTTLKDGVYIPNSMGHASNIFTQGGFAIEMEVEVTDGTLTVGVKNDANANLWCIWDNFQITCKKLAVVPTVIEATDAAATYYASDGDWYCVLKDADNNLFYFDIVTNNPAGLEIDHEYTLDDMDASYSYMKVGSKKYAYSSATFTPKQGQYGTDYEATCVLASDGTAYHIFYTAPKPETLEVEATTAGVTWYGEPDNDWFINLYNANFEFRFDIGNQSAEGLLLDHEYTLADMIADYSWGKNKATNESITYQSVSFKATTGANGTDYQAVVVDKKGNTYNVKYTTVAPPPTTETVELEFSAAETDLVDAASSMGLIQFTGAKEETGLEAYVGLHATQVAGNYTFADVEAMYTAIYLDYNDLEGVQCADLTGTVTDLGNGAYKAYFEYLGTNGTLYKLTYNYGEAGDPTGEVVVNKDANGIITSVTGGEARVYVRSTEALYYNEGIKYQSGNVNVVVDGNDFYIKDPICGATLGAWVKGTLSADGKTLTVPASQHLYFSSNYNAYLDLTYGDFTGQTFNANTSDDITYSVDGNVLTLNGADATIVDQNVNFETILGIFWSDDKSWQQYGEWNTVLTYDPDYVAPSTDLVELPAGAEVKGWTMNATSVTSSSSTPIMNQAVNVAFVGNDVYAQGVFSAFPTAWIKGTKEGNTVTFKKLQYIGKYGSYDMYFIGTDGENLTDATATLSTDGYTLTFNNDILANAATDRIYYLTWLENAVLNGAHKRNVTEGDYGTICLPYAVDAASGAEFYSIESIEENGHIVLGSALSELEAGKPYIFKATASSIVCPYVGSAVSAPAADDYLTGVFADTQAPVGAYVMQKNDGVLGFYQVDDVQPTVKANRAYLTVDSNARVLTFGGETAISNVKVENTANSAIFNLAGQRVNKAEKGIFIINGKKVIK